MRVVEYLKGIEHCLDMDLENEWGVSPLGNFVILAEEGERRKLWDYVHNSGSYHFLEKIRSLVRIVILLLRKMSLMFC